MTHLVAYLALFLLFFWIVGSIAYWSIKNGITPMPSSRKAKEAILRQVPETFEGNVYELGCGWGTLIVPLAKKLKHCSIKGYESSPIPFSVSYLRAKGSGLNNICLSKEDFYEADLRDASLVVCYLFPKAMHTLKNKFERELPPGAIVISNTFAVPGWKPEQIIELQDIYRTKIYRYRKEGR